MLEREFMKKWVEDALRVNRGRADAKRRYWLRIPDSAEGIKPFDGILWLNDGRSIAIEFKVWRYKQKFNYSTVETHQMKALLDFRSKEAKREAWIVVYHELTGKTKIYHPSKTILERMLKDGVQGRRPAPSENPRPGV
jgi:Holliday junction resolvase